MLMHPIATNADPRPATAPLPASDATRPAAILAALFEQLRRTGGFRGALNGSCGFETRPMSPAMEINRAHAPQTCVVLGDAVAVARFTGRDSTGMAMTSIDAAITRALKTPPAWTVNDAGHMSTRFELGGGRSLRITCHSSSTGAGFAGTGPRGATVMLNVLTAA
jgi:hypothetical protein